MDAKEIAEAAQSTELATLEFGNVRFGRYPGGGDKNFVVMYYVFYDKELGDSLVGQIGAHAIADFLRIRDHDADEVVAVVGEHFLQRLQRIGECIKTQIHCVSMEQQALLVGGTRDVATKPNKASADKTTDDAPKRELNYWGLSMRAAPVFRAPTYVYIPDAAGTQGRHEEITFVAIQSYAAGRWHLLLLVFRSCGRTVIDVYLGEVARVFRAFHLHFCSLCSAFLFYINCNYRNFYSFRFGRPAV